MILDYRSIPYEELDSNIPVGRGMIKWMPFATMPEQYENIQKMIDQQTNVEYPKLTQDIIEHNERMIHELLGKTAIIRYWSNGQEIMLECDIESISKETEMIIVCKEDAVIPIYFYHIYEVQKGDNLHLK